MSGKVRSIDLRVCTGLGRAAVMMEDLHTVFSTFKDQKGKSTAIEKAGFGRICSERHMSRDSMNAC